MIDEPVADVLDRVRHLSAEEILSDAASRYSGRVAFASSLNVEDQVLTHMIAAAGLEIPVFTIDTGRLFPEAYDLLDQTCERYGLSIAVYCPDTADVETMVARNGVNLFRGSRFLHEQCCETRKTRPLRRAQVGLDAWVCGSRTRNDGGPVQPAEWDAAAGLLELHPLAGCDDARVWDYVRAHDVPYNPLHDKGFPTIDCAPCTAAATAETTEADRTR
ncbi:MAG: phosphoadenylyl-sulfate reductase [Actinobacteria bacterium]|mgnify:CR=1 FL=1|nr:phosphoadenylyl-sulfate reductase [Actinomycetota bacterium]